MRPVVLLTHAIHQEAIALLQGSAEIRVLKQADEVGLLREIGDADALLVRMPVSRTVIRAGKRLRVVARHGVGVDYIPLDVCTELGIPVTNTPDANTEFVAEHVIGCMIALAHRIAPADRAVRQHNWLWRDNIRPRPFRAHARRHRPRPHRITGSSHRRSSISDESTWPRPLRRFQRRERDGEPLLP